MTAEAAQRKRPRCDQDLRVQRPDRARLRPGPQELARLWRGHDDTHSEDVTIVPLPPNYSGSFGTTSHSGPWDYVQTIPLVMYGPGNIKPEGRLEEPASIADVYPTAGRLTGVDLPQREGRVLDERSGTGCIAEVDRHRRMGWGGAQRARDGGRTGGRTSSASKRKVPPTSTPSSVRPRRSRRPPTRRSAPVTTRAATG